MSDDAGIYIDSSDAGRSGWRRAARLGIELLDEEPGAAMDERWDGMGGDAVQVRRRYMHERAISSCPGEAVG